MAKKYEGGWGIRARKNLKLVDSNIWLSPKGKLTTIDKAKRFDTRDGAYQYLDYAPDLSCPLDDWFDFAVDKLPVKWDNSNPDCPWDVVFDHVIPPSCEPGDLYDENWFPLDTGFTYKKVDNKSKEGKLLLELICKLFGI